MQRLDPRPSARLDRVIDAIFQFNQLRRHAGAPVIVLDSLRSSARRDRRDHDGCVRSVAQTCRLAEYVSVGEVEESRLRKCGRQHSNAVARRRIRDGSQSRHELHAFVVDQSGVVDAHRVHRARSVTWTAFQRDADGSQLPLRGRHDVSARTGEHRKSRQHRTCHVHRTTRTRLAKLRTPSDTVISRSCAVLRMIELPPRANARISPVAALRMIAIGYDRASHTACTL